jgi:hypothetical protein
MTGVEPISGSVLLIKGRPKLPKRRVKKVIAIRLTGLEKREYETRASRVGMSLSDWVRQTLQHGQSLCISLAVTSGRFA